MKRNESDLIRPLLCRQKKIRAKTSRASIFGCRKGEPSSVSPSDGSNEATKKLRLCQKKTPKLFFSDIGVMRIDRLENDKKVNNSQRLSHKNWKVGYAFRKDTHVFE